MIKPKLKYDHVGCDLLVCLAQGSKYRSSHIHLDVGRDKFKSRYEFMYKLDMESVRLN